MIFLDLPHRRAHALALALNKLAEKSPWDKDKLRNVIMTLSDLGTDLSITGFDLDEIREMGIGGQEINKHEDDAPPPPPKAISKPGDVWIMGEHRLLCGDSRKAADVARIMNGKTAALWATDPPYCVDYTGNDRPNSRGKDWTDVYHETEPTDLLAFLREVYTTGLNHVSERAPLYLWHADKRRSTIEQVAAELNLLVHQTIIWVKPCIVLGYSFYARRHEPCVLMWRKGFMPPIGTQTLRKTNKQSSVWPVPFEKSGNPLDPEYYTDVYELDYDGKKRRSSPHPTMKPVEIFAIPMRIHTKEGDLCYEPFSGSGSQFIAAEKTGRRCYGIEIEPRFCDAIVERWQQFTGGKAKRERK